MKIDFSLGLLAAFFFSFTFILNSQMNISGGSWIWSASLRYLFMFPILFIIVALKKEVKPVFLQSKMILHLGSFGALLVLDYFMHPLALPQSLELLGWLQVHGK